jgi:hypothetical protein
MRTTKDVLDRIWDTLLASIKGDGIDVVTVRLDERPGKWFAVRHTGNTLLINNSRARRPSVALAQERAVGKEEFIRIGQLYDGWRNGHCPEISFVTDPKIPHTFLESLQRPAIDRHGCLPHASERAGLAAGGFLFPSGSVILNYDSCLQPGGTD